MGRSQLTTSDKLRRPVTNHFGNFRRALMGSDARAFDQLVAAAKNNRMAISQAKDVLPVTAMLLAMLVDIQLRVMKSEKQVEELRQKNEVRTKRALNSSPRGSLCTLSIFQQSNAATKMLRIECF